MALGTSEDQLAGAVDHAHESVSIIPYDVLCDATLSQPRPAAVLPPHSRRHVVVECDPGRTESLKEWRWMWATRDTARALHVHDDSSHQQEQGDMSNSRRGLVLADSSFLDTPVHRLLSAVPVAGIRSFLHSNKSDTSSTLPRLEADALRGDLYCVRMGANAHLSVDIAPSSHGHGLKQELQVAVIAVSSETPVLDDAIEQLERPCCVVVTGQCVRRYKSDESLNRPVTMAHQVQLHFPRCGSFRVYPLVRELLPQCSSWWTSPVACVRVVVVS